jgi:sRNA-binding regulator protein Hfq
VKNRNKNLKLRFSEAVKTNKPTASIFLWDGSIFYGRVIRQKENMLTLIGMKKKRIYIYTGEQNGN